ncbi:MAG: hypothetical protein ACOYMA_14210 [Bacteroidia bacterium]
MVNLDNGIFLEDNNVLLKWRNLVEQLAIENKAEIIRKHDRTIIEWGTHNILDGLKLNLTNVYLLTARLTMVKFTSIESWYFGDKDSFENFNRIKNHLLIKIGEPIEKFGSIKTDREECWIWKINLTKITLFLFEQHVFKMHFKIEHNQD